MASLLKILILLFPLTATSYALSCTQCTSIFSSTCSGEKVTCPAGSLCGVSNVEINVGGIILPPVLIRRCMPSPTCDLNGSMSMYYGQIKRVTLCCGTDGCDPTISTQPLQISTPNGLACRSCTSDWCLSSDTIHCRGDENVCLLLTAKITGPVSISVDIPACAAKSLCDIPRQSHDLGGINLEFEFTCRSDAFSCP